MARKMTESQIVSLARIDAGWPETNIKTGIHPISSGHRIVSRHHCMDPDRQVRCHRTILTNTPAGSKVQSFRIAPDGTIERKL